MPSSESRSPEPETLENAKTAAKRNIKRLQQELPKKLKIKEQNLYKRIRKLDGSAEEKLKLLYQTMDDLGEFTNRYTACKTGCSACCHYKITVSEVEATLIERATGVRTKVTSTSTGSQHGTPCPFLLHNKCSIYEHRPYVCRRHVSLAQTARWCAVDVCNKTDLPLLNFSEADKGYQQLIEGSKQLDIREWFAHNSGQFVTDSHD